MPPFREKAVSLSLLSMTLALGFDDALNQGEFLLDLIVWLSSQSALRN
jgi:hypothetical protein